MIYTFFHFFQNFCHYFSAKIYELENDSEEIKIISAYTTQRSFASLYSLIITLPPNSFVLNSFPSLLLGLLPVSFYMGLQKNALSLVLQSN